MDRAQLESKVLEIITTKGGPFPDGPPTLDKPWSSLGMDSLDQLELVMSVEDEFDLEITDETAESFKDGKDVVDYLVTRVK